MSKYTRYIIIFLFAFASIAIADQGSGDSYGYNWTNSGTPAPTIGYSWVDLAGETSLFGDVFDDNVASVTLPFSFTLYGTSKSQLYISSNGWISFVDPGGSAYPLNAIIPSSGGPDELIAPFWDDLESTTGNNGGVYYRTDGTTPNRQFIIEWDVDDGSNAINFEAILYEHTNIIKFQYNTINGYGGGGSATIGIKANSTLGNQYCYNSSDSVSTSLAILFHNESVSGYSASLLPASVEISEFVTFTYTINNIDPGGAVGLGKLDRVAIGNPFSTTPTITSVMINGQNALIQNTTAKPTDPTIATWYYDTSGDPDSLIIQTTRFNVAQSVAITYLQAIPDTSEGNYTYGSTADAELYTSAPVTPSSQPQVSVTSGSVEYIIIRDASDGGGSEVTSLTMTTDESLTLYAAGYDAGDNFVNNMDVTWTLTGDLDGGGGGGTYFMFTPSRAPRSGTIEAEYVLIGATDATGTITVNPGDLATLQIRTAENGGGSPVTTFNMTTDDTQRFWAAGYDAEGNFRGNESVDWSSTLGIAESGESIDYSPSAPITGTLTARNDIEDIEYTANIQVATGALDYLMIRDTPGGVGLIVSNHIMNTNQTLTLYAAGYDAENNYKEDYVAVWTLTGTLDQPGVEDSIFVFSPSSAPTSGSILATVGNISDATGTIEVNPGILVSLQIRTAPNNGGSLVTTFSMTTDESQTFWAAGFDDEGNYRGAESVTWSSAAFGVINQSGDSLLFQPTAPDTGILTITSGIISYNTGDIEVTVGDLDYLIISDGANGTGNEFTSLAMTTDDSITLYAAGYDQHGNFRQDEDATDWTVTGNLDGPGPTNSPSFNFSPFTAPTTGSITASVGSVTDATGTIDVNTGALSSLLIRTESNNNGYQVITFSMTTDESQTFWSAGYDADGNYRGDEETTDWTSTGDLGLSGTGDSIIFTPSAPVSGTLIATVGGSISYETGLIMVGGGGVDHIIIRDAPDGGGNEVITHAMTTDESLTLYAAGYDEGDTFVENTQVNWTLTGGLDGTPVSDTVFVFSPALAPRSGTINAQIGTIQDATGTITVNTGALASLLIRDEPNNGGDSVTTLIMSAGDSRTFYAAGYDADGNYRRDEPDAEWTSTFGLGDSGSSFLFTPTLPDTGTITVTIGAIEYTTGDIIVLGGSLGYLVIRDGPHGGGNDLTDSDSNLTADGSLTLYAAGYDASDNYIGDQLVDWFSTGTLDYIDVNASSFIFNPVNAPSSGTIGITNGTFGNTTGTINVSVGALNYITINSSPGAAGTEIDTLTLTAGIPTSFYAVGYDSDGNYRSEVEVDWSSTGNLDEVTGTGTSIIFNPVTAPSTGTIVADTAGIFTDETGLITVEEGNLDYIEIRTAAGGAGVIVGDTSLTTDQSLTMYAAGYDGNDNYLYDVPVSWSSTGNLDVVVETGPSFTFNPATAPTGGTIVATSGLYSGQTGTITVSVGALDHITINSSSGAGGVPVETLSLTADDSYTFYAASYDADNNFIAMVAAIWDQTGNLNDVFGTGTSYTFDPVTAPTSGTITAIFSGESDATGTITVEPGALDYVLINDAAGAGGSEIGDITLNVGVDLVLYASGYDQHGNYRGPEEAIWRSTGSLDDVSGVSENYTFTPISVSSGTIIATSGIVSDTTGTITVEEGVLTWIQIRTAPDGEGSEFGTHSLSADESVTLYAAGYDAGDNLIGDIVVDWTSTGTLETISASDSSFLFSPTVAPTYGTIRATSGAMVDETGTITVSPGAPVSVTDYDDLSGERTTVAGSTQLIRVLVEDQHGNPVSGVIVNFSPADDMSVPSDITDADGLAESVYNTPRNQDSSIVQASVSGLSPYNFIVYGINYVSGSLDPAVVQRGGTPSFTVQVSNPGNTVVPLTTGSSNFSFSGGSFNYSATLASPATLTPNSSAITLTFTPTLIDENFPGGSYTAEIQLVGSGSFIGMNGVLQTDIGELTIGDENITIGTIQIIGPEGPTDQLLQGEQDIIARVPVTNVGNVLEIDAYPETRIEFRRHDNGQSQPVLNLERTDGLLFLQSGGVINYLEFQFDLPPDYQTGQIDVYAVLSLDEGTLVKAPEDPSGSFNVLQAGNANYVEGSLDPDEVVPRETVYFSASFENTGSASIVLDPPAASTIEILGTGIGPRNLIGQFTLTGNTTTEIHFDPLTIPVGLSTGKYDVRWHLNGTLGSHVYDSIGVITDGLTVVSAADLSFSNINVIPDRVKQDQTGIDIIYTINNEGESAANITALDHQFNFSAGGEVPPFQWILAQIEPQLPVQVAPGGNRVLTATYNLSKTATTGWVYPNPSVEYNDVRTPSIKDTSNTIKQNDQVEVVQPASVKIVRLQVQAPNTPFVNKDQEFSVDLTLENTGADQIDTAWVSISRNQEPFTDQLVITNIAAGEQKSAGFQHSEPNVGIFVYKAKIEDAKDALGDPVLINQPDDDDELVYVQEPSRLEIDASILSNSIVYDSLIVSEEQIFMIRANITNFGESSFSADGNGRLALRLPGTNFSFVNDPSDSVQTFTAEDTLAEWAIQASGISPGGIFEELAFSLVGAPVDTNTGEVVQEISIIDSVVHIKSEEKGIIIRNDLSILSPEGAQDGRLSTKQEFTVGADIQFNSTIADDGRTAGIDLPYGYSLKDGEQLIIDLPPDESAEWTIIALDRDRTGDEIFVTARGYDRNSGISVTRISNSIPLSVVERTDLTMTLQILKTGGSPGDTLSVGQKFTLQALINNDGKALPIGEGKVTIEGIEDNDAVIFSNLPQEDTLSFTIGEPVSWDLEIIQLPGGQSGIQPQIFQLMKELDKETAKTVSKGNNKITTSSRARELFNQISDMTLSLVTLELNLTVKMSKIPGDENTNQTAYTQDSIVTKTTYVQPVAGITIQLIETPASVSTDQEFDLVVTGNLINNLKDPSAHLLIPPSFEDYNGSVLDLPLETGSDQAHFKIKVPPTANFFGAARETLKVYLTGEDLNSGEQVLPSPTVSRVVTVQLKPEIYMAREIISPLAARESGSLSHGQSITIEVWPALVSSDKPLEYAPIDNDGSIDLDSEIFSSYQFERVDGEIYKKTFTQLNQKLSFTLRAPRQNRTALINLRFIDLPVDNNSRNFVDVDGDSGSVSLPMTVTEKKITVIMQKEFEKTTFTRGEGHHLIMAFEISNAGYLDSLTLQGLGIKFIARSDTASLLDNAIVNIFEKIFIVDYNEFSAGFDNISDLTSYAEFEVSETNVSNPLQIEFDDVGYLNGNESKNLAVVAMFRAGESSRSFRTILNNINAYDDSPENLVSIVDSEGRSIEGNPAYLSNVFSLISNDQEKTFGNFPNPFGRPPNETTEIRFLLQATSDVTLRIFSLAGELVRSAWNRNLTNLPGGEILYYVVWDGKNDEGYAVLNGVYICVIEIRSSSGTKTYTTKIAYIK